MTQDMSHEIVRVISICTREFTKGVKMYNIVEIPNILLIIIRS
jgi:hypothetical protein